MILGLNNNKLIEETIEKIQQVYLMDKLPWVVGFSGGKDSTALTQLIFQAVVRLPLDRRHKKVYVISSDTLVETPLIISSINKALMNIQVKALELGLPVETHKVKPQIENSFWSSIIGKGYPSPRQKFRWCTDRMKIDPANRFIRDKVDQFGEVVMVLGVREDESATRTQVINSHTIEGKVLMRHSTLSNAFVYAPIKHFTTDDVWKYLRNEESPWGSDNHALYALYQNSSGGECPLIVDKDIKESAGSCGNSRFGCWTCTVVSEDKALRGFIETGEAWLRPLLEFRDWLSFIRDQRDLREKQRMDGGVYFVGQGDERELGLGPFTLAARYEILRKLLKTQLSVKNPYDSDYKLILDEELKHIRRLWIEDGDWSDTLPKIYKEVTGEDLDWEYDDRAMFEEDQITDLELLCDKNNISMKLLKKLITTEKKFSGYKVRRGIIQEFNKILNQDWLHYGKVEGYKE
ncbi:DNA phosphorothioation system sulfurtransferase DndC [Paenibacillus sp. YYML68]|uniref:DNA phosphorothioation system sulfurtransferase DndC n=1 Tax=Paenibacillus sp. YYML68 TaxID=2909250 RepID=UPI00248F7FDA|nr:DNA phosphorothioation system sulfurtransferase DndC [Paenibacillus sp. YYML68]